MVHHAVAALGLICCIALLGSCGGASSASSEQPKDVALTSVGTVREADCTDWKNGTVDERVNTVAELRRFAGGPVGSSAGIKRGPVLDDGRAYRIFESYCRKYFARGFKLYKLYERAAAYVGPAPPDARVRRPRVPLPR